MENNQLKDFLKENYSLSELNDLRTYGAQGGFHGFIYYSETTAHFNNFEDDIFELLADWKDSTGEALPRYIAENMETPAQFKNFCVWFAIEYLAGEILDESEEETEGAQDD